MKKMALRLIFLLSIALLLGVVVNCFSPHRIAWVKDWGHYIEAQAFQEGFLLANRQSVARAVQTGSHFLLDGVAGSHLSQNIPAVLIQLHLAPFEIVLTLQSLRPVESFRKYPVNIIFITISGHSRQRQAENQKNYS